MRAYAETLRLVRESGCPVIADIKRGGHRQDGGNVRQGAPLPATLKPTFSRWPPYMGLDSISPYLPYCQEQGKGVFVLCRTSQPPGRVDFEYQTLADWPPGLHDGRRRADQVGRGLPGRARLFQRRPGHRRHPPARKPPPSAPATPGTFFLIPGYGAQGGQGGRYRPVSQQRQTAASSTPAAASCWPGKSSPGVAYDEAAYNECVRMKEDIQGECDKL